MLSKKSTSESRIKNQDLSHKTPSTNLGSLTNNSNNVFLLPVKIYLPIHENV